MTEDTRYGMLKCRILEIKQASGKNPHYHLHTIADDAHFRIAINVKSQLYPHEVLYYINENYEHDLLPKLEDFPFGFHEIGPNIKKDYGLDYLRGSFVHKNQFRPLSDYIPGPNNDLNEKIHSIMNGAIKAQESILYVFGRRWGPEGKKDAYFRFSPADGLHDVHMNQGNVPPFDIINDCWQDGGLFIHFVAEKKWTGIFLAFQSQSFEII